MGRGQPLIREANPNGVRRCSERFRIQLGRVLSDEGLRSALTLADHVVVVASGETERRSLPHLVSHLQKQGTSVDDVRIPPRNKALDVGVAEKIIKSIWYENPGAEPDKIVLLLDVDRKSPDQVVGRMKEDLASRLPAEIKVRMQYAHAQPHLEAWYFADGVNLRGYLKRDLGRVDDTRPDEIENPKLHLKNILDEQVYTARVSAEIARAGTTMHHRSRLAEGDA